MKTNIGIRTKNAAFVSAMLLFFLAGPCAIAQNKRSVASAGRAEFIEVEKNVRLHVTDLGEGQPIVLIHGWPLSDEMYEFQYQYLVQKGFRVIGISLRGFGKSDKPYGKYDFDVFSDDIKAVLDELKIEDAVLGGFSMGGAAVIHYVLKYKSAHVRKLALFAAAAPSWQQRGNSAYGVTAAAGKDLVKKTMTARPDLIGGLGAQFAAKPGSFSKNVTQWMEILNLAASPFATTTSMQALLALDLRPDLARIDMPVVIFQGAHDKLVPPALGEELHKGIKNSQLIRFENSGHALFVEEADKFNTELEKFARSK